MSERFREKKRFVRYKEGAKLYGLCQSTFEKRAKEAGATYKVGKAVIVDCEIFEKYLESFRIPAEQIGNGKVKDSCVPDSFFIRITKNT